MLELKQIRKTFSSIVSMNKNTSVFLHIGDMVDRDYVIDFDVFLPSINKNLQRPFCWTLFQKQQLIISILKGISIPKVSVVQYKDDIDPSNRTITIKVIDGKQRMNAILEFYQGKFPIEWYGKPTTRKETRYGDKNELCDLEVTVELMDEWNPPYNIEPFKITYTTLQNKVNGVKWDGLISIDKMLPREPEHLKCNCHENHLDKTSPHWYHKCPIHGLG